MITSNKITRLPSHFPGRPDWQQNTALMSAAHYGKTTNFTYTFPVIKWSEAIRATAAPTYKGGEAYSIGKQPYDSRELWIAKRTPATPRLNTWMQGTRPSNVSASVLQAQQTLAILTQNLKG
jgi:hypothetical protein